ncbi:MAG TPA: hypothetical protein PLQ13_04125 [Candidatus Krumholzibacteria bacterium]|nr:hypothetical protein [Candidatus Krumholzibacteria bacterium]
MHPLRPLRWPALAAALLLILPPAVTRAAITRTMHLDGPGDVEGDPIDSNDFGGGGGGGSHDDIHDSYALAPAPRKLPVLVIGRWTVLLVPDGRFGLSAFSFVVLESNGIVEEAGHAH